MLCSICSSAAPVPSSPFTVRPRQDITFTYQSKAISFSEWLTLLTLAFAPLIAHILVGVVEPTVLRGRVPWNERICHFNPTSIIWRYFAITDRRCRAREWTRHDLAVSNAVFWDGRQWDGSEAIMMRKRYGATRLPDNTHVSLISKSIFQTLIVSLQGIQAAYTVVIHAGGKEEVPGHPISHVFFPLALLGLLRLPAALWLTEEYGYPEHQDPAPQNEGDEVELNNLLQQEQAPPTDGGLVAKQFHLQTSWRGVAVRIVFLGALLAMIAATITAVAISRSAVKNRTFSEMITAVYYLFFLIWTFSTLLIYVLKGKGNTTVIPCIESPLYKAYTYILILLSIGYIVVAALETRRTACGLYTTSPVKWGQDDALCKSYNVF